MVHKEALNRKFSILIITVSTSRTKETDTSGENLKVAFLERPNSVDKIVCRDNEEQILNAFYSNQDHDIFIFVGGTGPSKWDMTVQSIRKIAEKEMIGFGELFRAESKEKFAYLSNTTLFIKGRKQLYCVPGSPDATEVAFSVISSMMGHLYEELYKE